MQNRWFTYSFLLLMGSALITLAVLQFQWVGSVSDAEKQRLKDGIEASGENFVSDFNEVFVNLKNIFRIQVTDENTDITPELAESYLRWNETFDHRDLLSEVLFIQISDDQLVDYFKFDATNGTISSIQPDSATVAWVEINHLAEDFDNNAVSLNALPEFSDPTFIAVPIQVLDFITLNKQDGIDNLEVRLSIDRLNDLVLLRINDDYVKTQLIPEIASTYFGDSYFDQYQLSVLKPATKPFIYYNSQPDVNPSDPDLKVTLDRLNFSNLIMFDDNFGDDIKSREGEDSVAFSFRVTNTNTDLNTRSIKHITQFEGLSTSRNIHNEEVDSVIGLNASQIDTTITTAFVGHMNSQAWELWLSFKAGSLDEFVDKTRTKNLGISFGILFVLGISSVLIVVFAQRSKNLAEQQMLFVAGVSHELRTPLTIIRSAAENLTEGVIQSEDRKKEYAQLMLKEGRRLSEMVDQIMEFSGIQSGRRIYSFSNVDVEQLMSELLVEFKPIFLDHLITLEYVNIAKLNTIKADRNALFLAISNLLHNAIKFSNGGKQVILRLDEISYKSDLALRIQVKDFGVGIPAEEFKDIFKPFYRGRRSVDDQIKGNGIGLSLIQKVAQAHQGSIQLKSEEGKGSTFILIIPYH